MADGLIDEIGFSFACYSYSIMPFESSGFFLPAFQVPNASAVANNRQGEF
jgi:hypothetical protein